MNRSIYIILNKLLAQQNSILVVITFPGHKTDQRVLAQTQFTHSGGRTVSNHLSRLHTVALQDDRSLIVAVGLVASGELGQMEFHLLAVITGHANQLGRNIIDYAGLLCNHTDAGVHRSLGLHTGAYYGSLRGQKRHCLTLHVGSHQRTVCIIILQEGNQCSSHREYHSG